LSAEPARAVWFLDEAEDDIAAAFEWYQSKRVGLGVEFVHAVDAVLASLLDFPESLAIPRPCFGVSAANKPVQRTVSGYR
jgi:hypothetical protein